MLDSDDILWLCDECCEETLEGIRAKADAVGIPFPDEDIEWLILRPRLVEAYVLPPFNLAFYQRHL